MKTNQQKFWITYNNPDSESNGKRFLVRESENHPHRYLISDGESHVGGGTLSKKYCEKDFPVSDEKIEQMVKELYGWPEYVMKDILKKQLIDLLKPFT